MLSEIFLKTFKFLAILWARRAYTIYTTRNYYYNWILSLIYYIYIKSIIIDNMNNNNSMADLISMLIAAPIVYYSH